MANDQTNEVAQNSSSFNKQPFNTSVLQALKRDTAYVNALRLGDQNLIINKFRFHLSNAIKNNQPSVCYFFLTKIDSVLNNAKQEISSIELQTLKAKIKSQWGIYYSMIGMDKKAVDSFHQALEYYNQSGDDSIKYGGLYYNYQWTGLVHKKNAAYESAIQDNLQALHYLNKYKQIISSPDRISDAGLYLSLSDAYLAQGDTLRARKYSEIAQKRALSLYERSKNSQGWNSMITDLYLNLARFHFSLKETEEAISYCKIILQFPEKNKTLIIDAYLLMGDIYRLSSNFNTSLEYYKGAQRIISSFAEEKGNFSALVNLKLARLYEDFGNIKKAYNYYHFALNNSVQNTTKSKFAKASLKSIDTEKIINKSCYLDALQGIAKINFSQFINSKGKLYLEDAQKNYDLSIALLDSMNNDLPLIEDKNFQITRKYPIYEEAILVATKSLELFQGKDQIRKIFKLFEKSKYFTLNQLYTSQYVSSEFGSPLIEQERLFRFEIKKREEQLRNSNISFTEDSLYAELIARFRSWNAEAKSNYFHYFNHLPEKEHVSLQKIQETLKKTNTTLIEYFWGNNNLFTLTITHNDVKVYQQELGTLADSLKTLRTLLTEKASFSNVSKIIQIQKISNNLYQRLLKPIFTDLKGEPSRLCIVRDGPLEYLPFEILDVSPKFRPGIFKQNDFLLSHFIISYAHSSTLWYKQQLYESPKASHFLACFAPTYQESAKMNVFDNFPLAMLFRDGSIALPGAQIEAKNIARMANGKLFKGKTASENKFKRKASQYSVLHLSMHALANDQIPESSELLFSIPNPDLIEDGHFKAWELHGLSLKAQMVVLSACQTGEGKIKRGEGALSLAYAFFKAGAPCVVSTQWNVHDNAAREIMESFYQYLKEGMSKDEALQQAKTKYLEHGQSHPFYWAPFIITGNTDQIKFPISIWPSFSLIIFFIALSFFLLVFYMKHKKLKPTEGLF